MTDRKSFQLNATSASLLGFLHEGPMTGWDINEMAEERIGKFWSVTRSQVYRELLTLAKEGYVTVGAVGVRKKQPYSLTEKGRNAFAQWINSIDDAETIRIPMLLAVSFSRFMDKEVLRRILSENLESHTKRLNEYTLILSSLHENAVASDSRRTLSFGIRYETMMVEWLNETLASYEPEKHEYQHRQRVAEEVF